MNMPLIEGFGDEVTIFAVLALLTLLILSLCYVYGAFTDVPINRRRSGYEDGEIQDQQQVDNAGTGSSATNQDNSSNVENLELNREAPIEGQLENEMQDSGDTSKNDEKADKAHKPNEDESTESSCTFQPQSLNNTDSSTHLPERSNVLNQRSASSSQNGRIESNSLDAREYSHPNQITIRIKYLNDTERTITTLLSEKIVDFKRNNFAEELSANQTVRLIFNGQLLRNELSLQRCGISDGCVVHVHVSQNDPQPPQSPMDSNVDLDLSHLLWPLFSVIIVIFWILYFNYPEFFSITSTSILLVLTGAFILLFSHGGFHVQNQQL